MDFTSLLILAARNRRHDASVWIVFAVAVILFVPMLIFMAISKWSARRRREQLQQLAERLGWEFDASDKNSLCTDLSGLPLFQRGRAKKASNVIRVTTGDTEAILFDYQFVTGSGKSKQTSKLTPVVFQDSALELPEFCLRRKNFGHRFASWFGFRGLDLPRYPELAEVIHVKGASPSAIEESLSPDLAAALIDQPQWVIESSRPWLLIYREGKPRVKTDQIEDFFREALGIFLLFARAGQKNHEGARDYGGIDEGSAEQSLAR